MGSLKTWTTSFCIKEHEQSLEQIMLVASFWIQTKGLKNESNSQKNK
jgi:hypothetical protein